MKKVEFLTIFPAFENLEIIKQTLPTVIEETKKHDATLIVHDSSVKNRDEQWDYLKKLNTNGDFFLILTDRLSMAHARNLCLRLGFELYAPDYVCVIEDDHGFKEGFIPEMTKAMKNYYGKIAPSGFRYGLFSGCWHCRHKRGVYQNLPDGNSYPETTSIPMALGGINNCCRCAPASHWQNILKGYDTDEYQISAFQTEKMALRNYNKGFTSLFVGSGKLMFDIGRVGRGWTVGGGFKLWDNDYAMSDPRSNYLGKPGAKPPTPPSQTALGKIKKFIRQIKK